MSEKTADELRTDEILFEQAKKLAEKNSFQNRTYSDQPLLFRASRLLNDDGVPEAYRELVKLSGDPRFGMNDAARFYEQSKLMENFEEDENYVFRGRYQNVYPTLARMNTDQLRGYFSWRTRVRHGRIEKTEYAFVVIYISELLNLIGSAGPEEGFEKLTVFLTEYSRIDSYLLYQGLRWAKNFAIYYNIEPAKYREFAAAVKPDTAESRDNDAICTLLEYRRHTKEETVSAICTLSTASVARSKWVKNYTDEVTDVIWAAYDALYTKYEPMKTDFIRILFPFMRENRYSMFFNSLFYQPKPHEDCVYRLSPLEIYVCRSGSWTCLGLELLASDYRSSELGVILKTVDYYAREYHGITPQIVKPPISEANGRIIKTAVVQSIEDRKEAEKQKKIRAVEINTDILATIRSDSDETREKLITEGEKEGAEQSAAALLQKSEISESVSAEAPSRASLDEDTPIPVNEDTPAACVFSDEQREFISLIISGGNLRAYAKSKGSFVSGFVEQINEITLEIIGDNALELEGDTAFITEDYIDDIKELAGL